MKYLIIFLLFIGTAYARTYPVDLNAKYIPYSISAVDIVAGATPKPWPQADGEEILSLDPDIIMLQIAEGTVPAYDDQTEVPESSEVIDLPLEEYRREWTIRAMTQTELDQVAFDNEVEDTAATAKVHYDLLKAHAGTSGDRMIELENVVAHLLKRVYGDGSW